MSIKNGFLACVLTVVSLPAWAADLPSKPLTYTDTATTFDWTGVYIGVHGGYGSVDNNSDDFHGFFVGGTIGYNVQIGQFVFGIEGDGAWSDISASAGAAGVVTVEDRINALGSITGRVGVAFNTVLVYAKGGYAFANNEVRATILGVTLSDNQTHSGPTVGGGVEVAFNLNWSVKGEYMFTRFDSETYFTGLIPGGVATGDIDVHTVKIGLNYRF